MLGISLLWLPGRLPAFQDGFLPEWEVRRLVDTLHATVQRFEPILQQFQPEAWAKNGASPEYAKQVARARQEIAVLRTSAERLAKAPNRSVQALDVYLRMENLEQNLNSITAAARRYQSPELAESVENALNEASGLRQRLRSYMVDLVAAKERESDVMDSEAQRCRGLLSKVPPVLPPSTKPLLSPKSAKPAKLPVGKDVAKPSDKPAADKPALDKPARTLQGQAIAAPSNGVLAKTGPAASPAAKDLQATPTPTRPAPGRPAKARPATPPTPQELTAKQ